MSHNNHLDLIFIHSSIKWFVILFHVFYFSCISQSLCWLLSQFLFTEHHLTFLYISLELTFKFYQIYLLRFRLCIPWIQLFVLKIILFKWSTTKEKKTQRWNHETNGILKQFFIDGWFETRDRTLFFFLFCYIPQFIYFYHAEAKYWKLQFRVHIFCSIALRCTPFSSVMRLSFHKKMSSKYATTTTRTTKNWYEKWFDLFVNVMTSADKNYRNWNYDCPELFSFFIKFLLNFIHLPKYSHKINVKCMNDTQK